MNVVILHYHFNRGGVTQVVLNHLRSLDAVLPAGDRLAVALIHGGRRAGMADDQLSGFRSIDPSIHAIPALDYDGGHQPRDERLAHEIREVLFGLGFGPPNTLLHFHNHGLGKNVSLPGAVRRLALDGFGVLLQLHDFPEDLRPANYRRLSEALASGGNPAPAIYPRAPRVHYAVLNRRDHGVLLRAGTDSAALHLLPNPAGEFSSFPSRIAAREKLRDRFGMDAAAKYFVYPVRGIRRKNLGEVLLWSALFAGETALGQAAFGVTLPPLNPVERPAYQHWMRLAGELHLPCLLETGTRGRLEFTENLVAADAMLTTSVAEGFGMVFLESWLAGLSLVGRDLPEITSDFVEAGIRLRNLYSLLPVPIEWVGRARLRDELAAAYRRLLREYGVEAVPSEVDDQVGSLLHGDTIDFAMLNSERQAGVIRQVCGDSSARKELIESTPVLRAIAENGLPDQVIAANAEVVRRAYSFDSCGRRLLELYRSVMASPPGGSVNDLAEAPRILTSFLDVSRLQPIRFE